MDRKYSEVELNSFNKAALISLFLSMQSMTDELTGTVAVQKEQLSQMNQKLDWIYRSISALFSLF